MIFLFIFLLPPALCYLHDIPSAGDIFLLSHRGVKNLFYQKRDHSFDYTNTREWKQKFPDCGGKQQSPINIEPKKLVGEPVDSGLSWHHYNETPTKLMLRNNGHTIQLAGDWSETPYLSGGILTESYTFSQLHFHWGTDDTTGSEHTICGQQFPLELHLVHYKTQYGNIDEAMKHKAGLVVVGFLFRVTKTENAGFEGLIEGANLLQSENEIELSPVPLTALVIPFKDGFATYDGSLTTPPCTEVVVWMVSDTPLEIQEEQLKVIRNTIKDQGGNIIQNYRKPQDLNDRVVHYVLLRHHN